MPIILSAIAANAPPTVTILEWIKRTRMVSFLLTGSQPIVVIEAMLTAAHGRYLATLSATDANAVTGLQLPSVPTGRYTLALSVVDALGRVATTSRASVEVTA